MRLIFLVVNLMFVATLSWADTVELKTGQTDSPAQNTGGLQ